MSSPPFWDPGPFHEISSSKKNPQNSPNRRPPIDIQSSLIFRMQTSQHFGKFSTNAVITLRQIAQTPVAQLFGIVYLKIEYFFMALSHITIFEFISFTNFTNKIHILGNSNITSRSTINTVLTLLKL